MCSNIKWVLFTDFCDMEIQTQSLQNPPAAVSNVTSSAQSASIIYQNNNAMPQIFTRRSSRNSGSLRKTSQPEETIHYSSEKDERIEMTVTDPIRHDSFKETPIETDEEKIKKYYKLFNTIIIYVEIAQSVMDITDACMSNESMESIYTRIKLPKILLKSTFAEYITRSSLRLKVNPPLMANKTTFNWTIQLQDMDVNTIQSDIALPVLKPWQTTLTVATTKRKQPVSTPVDLDYTFKSHARLGFSSPKAKAKRKSAGNERPTRLSQNSSVSSNSLEQIFSGSERSPSASPKPSTKHIKPVEQTGNIEKFEEIICLNVHLDSSIIHLYGNNMKILQSHCNHLMTVIEMLQKISATAMATTIAKSFGSFGSSSSKRQSKCKHLPKPLMILTSSEENQHIKEFMEMDTNSDASALPANESK